MPQVRQLSESVVHKTTLRNMRRLLRKLGFLTADGVVTLKGRVACEISTADELLSSELLFGGMRPRRGGEKIKMQNSCRLWMQGYSAAEQGERERGRDRVKKFY